MMDNNIFNNGQNGSDNSVNPAKAETNSTQIPAGTPAEAAAEPSTSDNVIRPNAASTATENTSSVASEDASPASFDHTPAQDPIQRPAAAPTSFQEGMQRPEAAPASFREGVQRPAEAKPAEPGASAAPTTYSYTSGGNPSINRDIPVTRPQTAQSNANTTQNNSREPGVHTTYVPHYVPRYTPANTAQPEKKKEKKERKSVPMIALILCLCAGIILSGAAGAFGVYVGSSLNSTKESVTQNNGASDGNGAIDAAPSEKVKIDLPEGTVAAAAQTAGDSVVEITTETVTTNFFYGQFVQSGAGSGVIIDADDGYIITCAHVVNGASSVTVTLKNGTKYDAELIGSDTRTDIAVIKINGKNLVAAELGNSDNLVVGQTAIAIGNPLGTLGGTVSSGIISALNREITIDGQGYSLLQIDTSINPGNSGGGLFDIEGKLIGVVNAKSGGDGSGTTIEGLGFAIPINQALEVANSLVNDGYVSGRANLGIMVYEINQNTSTASLYQSEYADLLDYITDYGVYFLEYQSGQNGDFEFGDRIIALDGVSVSTRSDIASLLEEYEVGDEITVTVSRVTSDMKRSRIVQFETTLVENVPETSTTEEE